VEKAGIKPGVWDWGSCGFISAESTEEDEVMGILRGEYYNEILAEVDREKKD